MFGIVSLLVKRTAKQIEFDNLVNELRNERQKTVNFEYIMKNPAVLKTLLAKSGSSPVYCGSEGPPA